MAGASSVFAPTSPEALAVDGVSHVKDGERDSETCVRPRLCGVRISENELPPIRGAYFHVQLRKTHVFGAPPQPGTRRGHATGASLDGERVGGLDAKITKFRVT